MDKNKKDRNNRDRYYESDNNKNYSNNKNNNYRNSYKEKNHDKYYDTEKYRNSIKNQYYDSSRNNDRNYHKYSHNKNNNRDYDYHKKYYHNKRYHSRSKTNTYQKKKSHYRSRSRNKKSDDSSVSTVINMNLNNEDEELKEFKEREKQRQNKPFVSAFTNFPFQLPKEITQNENYQTYNNLYNNQNITNQTLKTNLQNEDPQFSLLTNPYLVQSLSLLPTASKTDRKLYIGNLPPGMTPPSLVKMLNTALLTLKPEDFAPGEPVISSWISNDGHYAFVEFRTAEEATKGFILNGIEISGMSLKIGRPKTYQSLQSVVSEDTGPSNTVAAILMKNNQKIFKNNKKIVFPTKILCLRNVVKELNIDDEDVYNEVCEDVKYECEKYGKVMDIFMPRKDVEDNDTPGMGNVYIMFESVEQSKLARKFLSLKRYNNKLVYIQYFPEDNFMNKNFEEIR